MSFLDKLKQTAASATVAATNAANTAVKQTKTAAAIGKLKLNIAQEEDKMKKAYTELGRLYYRDYENQAEVEIEEYLPWIQRVSDAKAAIADYNAQVDEVKMNANQWEPVQVEEEEDTSIYVDFAEAEPVTVTLEPESQDAPEMPQEETPEEDATPTVGTLYVDISGQE